MLDLVLIDGKARGIVVRNLVTGELESHAADAVLPGDRRLRHRLLPVDQRRELERHGGVALRTSAARCFANPCFTQIHPTCIPVSRRSPVEAHADEREPAQRRPRVGAEDSSGDKRPPQQIPEAERDYYLERRYPSFGNLVPRDVASRAAKAVCDEGRGVGETRPVGLSRFRRRHQAARRRRRSRARYGNLFHMYEKITDEDPYKVPMRIYPAVHYTMGGLWVDYNLMCTIPGPARRSAKRTSPTTAPTASAPAR